MLLCNPVVCGDTPIYIFLVTENENHSSLEMPMLMHTNYFLYT